MGLVSYSGYTATNGRKIRALIQGPACRQHPNLTKYQDPHKNIGMEALLVPGGWPTAGGDGKGGTMANSL